MSTIKAIGGTLTQFGKKLALGITASSANVEGPQVEVNVPPEWEGTDISSEFRFSSSSGKYLDSPTNNNYVYHTGNESNFSGNGVVYSYDKDFGTNFALNQRAFVSASDRNTNDSITLTLMSESILSGSVDIREITMSDINVNFPDNGNSTSTNTASLFLTTSSNFQIFQDHDYRFVVRATDENNERSRLNIDGDSLNNIGYDLEYRVLIYPFGEKPFIITQSNDVGISASTSPNDHIGGMSFAVGNESSPDFTQIKDIFIKHRQFIGSNSSTEISTIKTFGDAISTSPSLLPGVQASNIAHYNTTTGSLPNSFVVSSSNLPSLADLNLSSSNRHFQINFNPDSLPSKLSAKNSPYIFNITASTGAYTPIGVGTSPVQTCSSSIQIVVTNENPVWSIAVTSATASVQDIDNDSKRPKIKKTYASASDPGEDNIALSLVSLAVASGNGSTGTKGFNSNYFDVEFTNNNTPTASFFVVTSSNFPSSFADGVIKGNEKVLATVRASDECSPAGTADALAAFFIDAPPSWSAVAQTIVANENSIGSILSSNTYKTVSDDIVHISSLFSGDVTLNTGSGFIINCADSRLSSSHFTFSGSTAIDGNNASFAIGTSSLYDRIDANAAVKIIVTASDNENQTAHHTFQVNITNVDEFVDVLGSDLLGDLRTFFSVRVDGATTQLGNTVADISSLIDTPIGSISIVSGSQTSAHITQSAQYSQTTITSANGNTVDFDVISTSTATTRIPSYSVNTLKGSGAGSFVLWSKTGARSSLSVENDTIFGQALGGLNENTFNFSSEAAGSPNAKLNIGNTSIDVLRYFNTIAEGSIFSGRDFHQLAVTWEGTGIGDEFKLYYNSTLVGSASSGANVGNAVGRGAYLGALGSDTETPSQIQPISMSIFASFNKQLSTSEVTTIFNAFSGSHGL